MKTLTGKWLKKQGACQSAIDWLETQPNKDIEALFKEGFRKKERLGWGNWIIVRLLNKKQKLQYAIYAAEQVLNIYEKKYPENKIPGRAIASAKKVLKRNTKKNRAAAYAAADAAYAAYAAAAAAYAAADAAYAAYAAAYAAYAAYAAAYAAYAAAAAVYAADAAYAAADAAAAKIQIRIKILKYGFRLWRSRIKK